ncbi:MAG: hypothetical protein M1826_000484 [Phylliscum demangeonii]|nr:MAG: hypothetical protein M1826_000484 [Phylliscum demangeonii]
MSYSWIGAPAPFNGTNNETGGDSAVANLNQWFQSGDSAFIIVASAMVLIMIPGLGFLYSGLARRKSALSMIFACMASFSVITFQWYLWGYSLAFSGSATNGFIGDLGHFALRNTLAMPSPGSPLIPELLYSFYQLQFCATTAAIVVGAIAERGRLLPMMVFIFCWATLVYCPIACWAWNANGWALKYGVLDYAGGGPVEIASGMSALAYSLVLGRRQERMMVNFRPHSVSLITLGTALLWFGWLGFNGGSAFGANLRAVMACWNSNLAAMFGAVSWVLLDYRLARKWSMVGWCSGAICGLVAATPASGFIPPWASIVLGIVAGCVCNFATKVKYFIRIDDSMDVFAEHGVAGMIGLLFNAFFGAKYIIGLDGVSINPTLYPGGFLDHNYSQLYRQVVYILAVTVWSFVISAILAFVIDRIPGLKLRASDEAELLGMDDDQVGEFAYDYVEVRRDYLAWTPPSKGGLAGTAEGEALAAAAGDAPNGGLRKEVEIPVGDRYGVAAHSEMVTASKEEAPPLAAMEKGADHTGIGGNRHAVAIDEKQ